MFLIQTSIVFYKGNNKKKKTMNNLFIALLEMNLIIIIEKHVGA